MGRRLGTSVRCLSVGTRVALGAVIGEGLTRQGLKDPSGHAVADAILRRAPRREGWRFDLHQEPQVPDGATGGPHLIVVEPCVLVLQRADNKNSGLVALVKYNM
ncbi:hypothetical protein GUJ93_ZPchr0002g26689 [Zizania palustris]|uniref:Uncharacterized protein n=1 Tax=Zizania palustris TaxID=103762 RepID=A0A8J5RSS4_ZIZPA|nr:hypothetical protein GUJ93_ZPchr0002g26689 [Zizania palustris]